MAILVPRQMPGAEVQYAPENIREPGTRNVGAATIVPKMIREAAPVPGISSGVIAPRLTTRTGTTDRTTINPLAGAAIGALMANMISQRQRGGSNIQTGGGRPGGTGGGSGGGQGGGQGGTRPGGGGPGGGRPPITPGGGTITTPVTGTIVQNADGTSTQTFDDGSTVTFDENGNVVGSTEASDPWTYDPESGTYYNSETGVYYDPETGAEEFPTFEGGDTGGGFIDQPDYGYEYDTGGYYPEFGYEYDTGGYYPEFGYEYDIGGYYPEFGYEYDVGNYDFPVYDYSYDTGGGYDFGGMYDVGSLSDFGSYDFSGFDLPFKKGGMATPLMKRGGIVRMSNGGDPMFTLDEISDEADFWSNYSNQKDSDAPMMNVSATMDSSEVADTSDTQHPYVAEVLNRALPGQPGYGWRYFDDGTAIDPQGNYYYEGQKVYDPNVGFSGMGTRFRNIASNLGSAASGALSSIQNYISQNPGTSGALAGALLSQILSSQTGGGRENLGVDMSRFGQVAPRTTTFGVGAPRFLTYEQYGSQQAMPEMYGTELYRNLNAPGFNPVNPTPQPAQQPMRRGGLAMADGGSAYYTYGRAIRPEDNLAAGGQPMMGGGAPMVQGRMDYRHGAAVNGPGDGQSDDIPAMLADGEYVIDAETVAMLGNGSNKAGAKKLDEFRMNIRKHKRNTPLDKIPPQSKSPLAYLKGAK